MNNIDLKNITSMVNGKVLLNESMSKHTTFGIGGKTKCYIMPKSTNELKEILKYAANNKIKTSFIGSGSNLLVSDNGYNGIIISLKKTFKKLKIMEDATIIAESGVMLGKMVKQATKQGIQGLENLIGVPGTVGGALYMNAGAYNHEISNYFNSAVLIDRFGNERCYNKNDVKFGYRYSSFPENEILVEAMFKYSKGNLDTISENKKNASLKRRTSQPLKYRSAGSIFKNPNEKISAGYLIDKSGLKGKYIGNAQISEKHGNFIINKGNAKAKDVMSLIKIIRKEVFEKFKIKLELEIKVIGEFDEK